MQKSLSFMSCLFSYFKGAIFCLTELLRAQGYDLSTKQDGILEWILYFKYYIQSLSMCYKELFLKANILFLIFLFSLAARL